MNQATIYGVQTAMFERGLYDVKWFQMLVWAHFYLCFMNWP